MTNGIIQEARNDAIEVLNQTYHAHGFISLDDATTCIQAYCNDMIEKIKQEFIGSSAIYTYQVRDKLIGDYQE